MKIRFILSAFLTIMLIQGSAQLTVSQELKDALQNKNSFEDVMKTVNDYYTRKDYMHNQKLYSEFKKWSRWGLYMGNHLDNNGQPVNISQKIFEFAQQNPSRTSFVPLSTPDSPESNTGFWTPIGPYTIPEGVGRVDRLAFHPTNQNIIYAGTPAGGLWRTLNGGANWQALNGYLSNIWVSGIVLDRDNPNIIYVLTGDGDSNINGGFVSQFGYIRPSIGILKSTDGGNSWSKLSDIVSPFTTFYGFKLIQSALFPWRLFACTSQGLYRSNDYGLTWVQDGVIGNQNVFDIEQAPGSGVLYVSTQNRVFISTDFGTLFTIVPNAAFTQPPSVFTQRTSLAVSPNAPNTLYVHFGGVFNNGSEGLLYRSDNNGSSFSLINANAPVTTNYTSAIAASSANINTVFLGNVDMSSSFNGGISFGPTGASSVHADVHDLQYNPLNNFLYAACDGGVYRSTDNGVSWFSLFNGMQITQYYHFTGVNGDNNFILGGAQDNGNIQSANNAGSYQLEWGGDGFESAYLNGNNNTYYFTTNTILSRATRTPSTRVTVTPPGADIGGASFYPTIAIHPTNNQIVYAGYSTGVFRSDDGANTWANKGNQGSAGGSPAGGLAVSPASPERIYAASNTTIWRSDNKGDAWTSISGTTGWPGASVATPITDITTRPTNADEIWITFGGYTNGRKVFYSSNAGASWINFSGSLPNMPVNCVKYAANGDVYVGTDVGVYFMGFAMSDWVEFSNGLPVVPVSDLFINEANGNIRAATFGRGIWQGDLYSACGPLLLLGGVPQGFNFYQSGGVIESTQQIPGSFGNTVKYRSPVKITLKPGFSIRANAYLHAVIGNCGQGVFGKASGENKVISKEEYLKSITNKPALPIN